MSSFSLHSQLRQLEGEGERTSSTGVETQRSADESKQANRYIMGGKVLVIAVLLIGASGIGFATHSLTASSENRNFESSFHNLATELLTAAEVNLIQEVSLLTATSTAITSYAQAVNASWPYVTVPHFEARAQELQRDTAIDRVKFVVLVDDADGWEKYSAANQHWVQESLYFHDRDELALPISTKIYNGLGDNQTFDQYAPTWQQSPVNPTSLINFDNFQKGWFKKLKDHVASEKSWFIAEEVDLEADDVSDTEPRGMICHPIFDDVKHHDNVVAFLNGAVAWGGFFERIMAPGVPEMIVEIQDTCTTDLTYVVEGQKATYIGHGTDLYGDYKHLRVSRTFAHGHTLGTTGECVHTVAAYPTKEFADTYLSHLPFVYMGTVLGAFVFTTLVFVMYDYFVHQRQTALTQKAKRSTAIVASLFPKAVQRQLEANYDEEFEASFNNDHDGDDPTTSNGAITPSPYRGSPIAQLFSGTTVLFADICGFTAWSSTREPEHVFSLLEYIYHKFDDLAKKRNVFKVETVGDCYVAATGLPDPRKDHHIAMAKFAADCMQSFPRMTRELVATLGPDVTDLSIRMGIHSGPCTAGVLRGPRARFQLFGDTMNTAARMESTGARGRIQVSQETAELLRCSGKEEWLQPRAEAVVAKGKGLLKTFWLCIPGKTSSCSCAHNVQEESAGEKQSRLVDWLLTVLCRKLRELKRYRLGNMVLSETESSLSRMEFNQMRKSILVFDEIEEILWLPEFVPVKRDVEAAEMELDKEVVDQLRHFIETLAAHYHNNEFHNFEHATHVTMSVNKLFHRIILPVIASDGGHADVSPTLYEQTYGIASDPMTRFTTHLSALIHDVDHVGLSNAQLINDDAELAAKYRCKSVAEQNSVDVSWRLLMQDRYRALRRAIYTTEHDFKRFRHLLVNIVMATDIMDKDLKALRNSRWETAFSEKVDTAPATNRNRKATIVIEHMIQASDVSHTMQHWQVYRKWNRKLFLEMYEAYKNGHSTTNPVDNWYKGEIGFFDFYVIPLARKLKECGVFGVASDEYLTYAQQNRKEWEQKGERIVEELAAFVNDKMVIPKKAVGSSVKKRQCESEPTKHANCCKNSCKCKPSESSSKGCADHCACKPPPQTSSKGGVSRGTATQASRTEI